MKRPPAWTGHEAQGLPGATCRSSWVIIDRLLKIAGGCREAAQQDMDRLLASAVEDGDQAAASSGCATSQRSEPKLSNFPLEIHFGRSEDQAHQPRRLT